MKLSNAILKFALTTLILSISINSLKLKNSDTTAFTADPVAVPAAVPVLPNQPLSQALSEVDPKRGMKLNEFISNVKFTTFKLSRGEAEQLFEFADQDRNDIVDGKEWQIFTNVFIVPFEACDNNKDYLLSPQEFEKCFEKEPSSRLVKFRNSFGANKFKNLMESVTCRSTTAMNFAEYFLIRRGLFAWKQCQTSEKYISASQFKCAIRTAIPPKYQIKVDLETIYNVGLKLANEKGLTQLDYVSYQRIVYFTYVFSLIGTTNDKQYISREQFLKFVKEQRYPTYFTSDEVEMLFKLINTNNFKTNENMSFETFAYFFNLHRIFNQYSKEKPLQLNKAELLSVLDDYLAPQGIVFGIDLAQTNFISTEYIQSSVVLQRNAPGEQNYYYGFKQAPVPATAPADKTAKAINDPTDSTNASHTYFDRPAKNDKNREVFFSIMTGTDRNYWTKEIFYRAMELGNLFTTLCQDKRWIVSTSDFVLKLNSAYDTVNPSINVNYRSNYVIYRALPKDLYLDILTFLSLENFKNKIANYADVNTVNEVNLKIVLQDYGMKDLPDTVLALSQNGSDSLSHKTYETAGLIKDLIVSNSVAGQRRRDAVYGPIKQLRYSGSVLA